MIVAPSFRAGASSSRSICWSGSKPCSSSISRASARRSRRRGPKSSLHHRRIRRVIRSRACGLDPATGGLRCLDALAADQKPFCQSAAKTGSTQCRSQSARGERRIWQRRFWEHLIRDDADDARHVEHCHINPLKHGLVERVRDWPYSSFRDVGAGVFPVDWGGDIEAIGEFGER
jgi:hypothetical protein